MKRRLVTLLANANLARQLQYLERKVRLVPDLREVWGYINPFMLYGRHMGFRGNFEKRLAERDPKAVELYE